uniref:Nuclear transport factor 2 family protein n=2 Tax=Bradyrhizobium amphicarpaeae TaxID=1404768 RepID=A0A2U8Q1K4_9BRAD|nr:nuclear transport factor 2 family protein [Bradyrhizobium amphicarpaeae]
MTCEVIEKRAGTFDSQGQPNTASSKESAMTDPITIARSYIELWNERAAGRRRQLLGDNWTIDASYVDPLMKGDGRDGIDALIAGVQQRFPDFRFKLIGEPNGYGDHVRFSWGLGPEGADSPIKGTDFAVLKDGRIRSVTGFLDQVPQGA